MSDVQNDNKNKFSAQELLLMTILFILCTLKNVFCISRLSWSNLLPSSVSLTVHLADKESVVNKPVSDGVLADFLDICWARSLAVTYGAHMLIDMLCGSLYTVLFCFHASPLPFLLGSLASLALSA